MSADAISGLLSWLTTQPARVALPVLVATFAVFWRPLMGWRQVWIAEADARSAKARLETAITKRELAKFDTNRSPPIF